MVRKGVVLSDEMLQRQARRILYDSDDEWNQTAADHPEWLDLFKKAHGLNYIPTAVGGQGAQVPEDLETYGDLGLRIPFNVQLETYKRNAERSATFQRSLDTTQTAAAETARHTVAALGTRPLCTFNRELPENEGCGLVKHGDRLNAVNNANAEGPIALTALKARMYNSCNCDEPTCASKAPYLSRHRLELPRDRAQRFETITGAWEDSGMMPETLHTSALGTAGDGTTIDAMMDIPSGEWSENLLFSNDQVNPSFATAGAYDLDWTFDLAAPATDAEMLQGLDDLIAATAAQKCPANTMSQSQYTMADTLSMDTSWMTGDTMLPPFSISAQITTDVDTDDLNFDDIVF
ncbi:hypothetical protein LTR08_007540 [Meristemomyces frigidus]|nr:hypothetical protein LTR08_007540 [Meristemomyces frigidus]